MELSQLRSFVMLAEIGNVRRAASLLAVSQPALSMRIKRLEDELGWKLFDRQARGVTLTQSGARWLLHCKQLLEHAAEATEAGRSIGRGSFDRIELGVTPIAALSVAPDVVKAYLQRNADRTIALTEGLSHELEEAVAQRRLDFALVHPPSSRDDVVVQEFAREALMAAVPASHPLASATTLTAKELSQETVLGIRRDAGPSAFDRATG
ncbi:MAG: LysR family transcriptional regulator [Pseudomonadota bacterium]